MGNVLKSKKGTDNWLFKALESCDNKQVEGATYSLNEALKKVKINMEDRFTDPANILVKNMVAKFSIQLQDLKNESRPTKIGFIKKGGKPDYPWWEENFQRWTEMTEWAEPMVLEIARVSFANFYPCEFWLWYDRAKPIALKHFNQKFSSHPDFESWEGKIHPKFKFALKEMIKEYVLEFINTLKHELGVNPWKTTACGETALILAVKMWDDFDDDALFTNEQELEWKYSIARFVYLLSQAGAIEDPETDDDATDQFGWTSLIWAAALGALPLVKILQSSTAELNFRDPIGRTALAVACEKGHMDVIQFLQKRGAQSYKDRNGHTPAARAYHNGFYEVAFMLDPQYFADMTGGSTPKLKRSGTLTDMFNDHHEIKLECYCNPLCPYDDSFERQKSHILSPGSSNRVLPADDEESASEEAASEEQSSEAVTSEEQSSEAVTSEEQS